MCNVQVHYVHLMDVPSAMFDRAMYVVQCVVYSVMYAMCNLFMRVQVGIV